MAENRNQVALYQEAADAMRDWARVIPGAVENLREANQKVYSKISDVAEKEVQLQTRYLK